MRIRLIKQARKAPSYASSKLWPTQWPTGVKCRATSVAKKLLNEGFRPEYRLWFSSCVVGGLGPLLDFLCTKCSANFSRDKDPFMGRALYNQNSRRILALFFYLLLKIYPSHWLFIKDSTSVDTGQTLLVIHIVGWFQCNFIGNLKPDLKHAIYLIRWKRTLVALHLTPVSKWVSR